MDTTDDHSFAKWGVKINAGAGAYHAKDFPAWANHRQRDDWRSPGVVIWSEEHQQVTRMSAGHAIQLLEQLRSTDDWRESGITVGEPVVRLKLPGTSRSGKGQPAQEPPASKPEHVLINTIALTGPQSQHLFTELRAFEGDLQRLAKADDQARSDALAQAYEYLGGLVRAKEIEKADLAARPVPWVLDEQAPTLTYNLTPNRVTVTPTVMNLYWHGCLERLGEPKDYSPRFSELEEALEWAEQQINIAATEAAQPKPAPVKEQRLSLNTLTDAQRAFLAPFWIEPAALEPECLTYRVCIHLRHRHVDAKAMELSFGEKFYYAQKYPTVLQIAQKFHFNGDLVDIKDLRFRGTYNVTSRTVYLDRPAAIQEAQRLWERSTLSSSRWSQALEWAYFGIQEQETGYLNVIGGIGEWTPAAQTRETFLANEAFSLTIAHALNVDYWHAMMGRFFANESDHEVLKMMHQDRSESTAIPDQAREESQRWLEQHRVG